MRTLPAFLLNLGLALLLSACRPDGAVLEEHRLYAMATWVDLGLPATASGSEPELIGDIESMLRQFERDYYAFGDGELARLNRALSERGSFEATPAMAALLESAQSIAARTGFAFDPGVGALVALWGFDGSDPPEEAPSADDIAQTLEAFASIAAISVDGTRIVANRAPADGSVTADGSAEFILDLGGIAKGAAVDRIVDLLVERRIEPALVNAGGDLRVIGSRPGRPWRIGIAHPRNPGLLGSLELGPGEAAFSSGDYERYFETEDGRMHHILDPRTGLPAAHTQAVTVVAADGMLADAAATALFVAGPAQWRSMARALGVASVLRVDASGSIEMTAGMQERFSPNPEVESDIIAIAD